MGSHGAAVAALTKDRNAHSVRMRAADGAGWRIGASHEHDRLGNPRPDHLQY
jgi:hypothetical protein